MEMAGGVNHIFRQALEKLRCACGNKPTTPRDYRTTATMFGGLRSRDLVVAIGKDWSHDALVASASRGHCDLRRREGAPAPSGWLGGPKKLKLMFSAGE